MASTDFVVDESQEQAASSSSSLSSSLPWSVGANVSENVSADVIRHTLCHGENNIDTRVTLRIIMFTIAPTTRNLLPRERSCRHAPWSVSRHEGYHPWRDLQKTSKEELETHTSSKCKWKNYEPSSVVSRAPGVSPQLEGMEWNGMEWTASLCDCHNTQRVT
jgi:hypothetical protein